MYTNNLDQLVRFLYFMITGMLLSIIFDIFRILRRSFKTSDIVTNIEDAIFGFLTGIILLASIFWINNGQLRFYILISITFGIFIYMLFISKYFIKFNVFIITAVKKIIIFSTKPFIILLKWIKNTFFKPFSFIFINLKLFWKKIEIKINKFTKRNQKNIKKEGF